MKKIEKKKVEYPFEVYQRNKVFVNTDMAKKMIEEGFREAVYGRYCFDYKEKIGEEEVLMTYEDPVLFGGTAFNISHLITYMDKEGGCIPLPTIDQYKRFYEIKD